MSGLGGVSSLPTVDPSVLPRAVREGTAEQQEAYRAALGFEQVLVQQLTKSLKETTGADDESSGASGSYAGLVTDAFADGITKAGGLGLAERLYSAMHPSNLAKTDTPKAGS